MAANMTNTPPTADNWSYGHGGQVHDYPQWEKARQALPSISISKGGESSTKTAQAEQTTVEADQFQPTVTDSIQQQQHHHQQQQQQHHLPQHHVAPNIEPSSVVPPIFDPPTHTSSTIPATDSIFTTPLPRQIARPNSQSLQQPSPYGTPVAYYGEQPYHAPQTQHTQQPSLVTTPPSCPGTPVYPIVSYPSAPVSSQYGTLRSSETIAANTVPALMNTSLHQQPPRSNTLHPAHSTKTVQVGYTVEPPPGPLTMAVNGQASTGLMTSHRHYDQSHQASVAYDPFGGVVNHSSMGPDGDRPCSGTIPSVHSSPGHHQGVQYGYVANNGDSSGINASISTQAAAAPSSSSSHKNEETGVDTSYPTISSASPMPNIYDSLEGGVLSPSNDIASQALPYSYYGYPQIPLAYQQKGSNVDSSLSHGGCYDQSSYQQFSQTYPNLRQEALRQVNLLQERNLLPPRPLEAPGPNLSAELKMANCSPQTFRCTLTSVPQTKALLNKAKLPLGLLLHPFKDLQPVSTSKTIVRCRWCRTYINPFVSFLDQRRWKCNTCHKINNVTDENCSIELHKRPEVQNSTIDYIANTDYTLRPPQPAVYLFVFDVSHNAVETGYLKYFCESLLENLDKLPGDTRTRVGFLTFDSTIHFYKLQEGLSEPQMLVVSDINDVFIPSHDSLMVNLKESKELVKDLLNCLPSMFSNSEETHSALGPALQAAYKLMSPTGGRVSVFQTQLPTLGAGLLRSREHPNQRSSTKSDQHLGPATDFYKKLALDFSSQQIGVDLFLLSSQYADLASLACVSKYSAGSIFYYPYFHHVHNPAQLEKFQNDVNYYLTRNMGFEAVLRIRCTKGLSIHTFHGNCFVRQPDLLSLANVNPDSALAVQMSIEDSLTDSSQACFQAALLYTSSTGLRRIRVHTICLPVVNQLSDVYAGADVQAITHLLANMAIDRVVSSSLKDARVDLVNAVVDSLGAYKGTISNMQQSGLIAPSALSLFPLYILALLKQKALKIGNGTRLDERVFAMCELKTQPLQQMMRMVHPDLYRLDNMSDQGALHLNDMVVPQPHLLHLSAERLSRDGAFLMDCGNVFYLWIGKLCNEMFIRDILGCLNYTSIPPTMTQIPELDTLMSKRVRAFLDWLKNQRPFSSMLYVVKDDASSKTTFFQHLVEERSVEDFSYLEFLQHIQQKMSK